MIKKETFLLHSGDLKTMNELELSQQTDFSVRRSVSTDQISPVRPQIKHIEQTGSLPAHEKTCCCCFPLPAAFCSCPSKSLLMRPFFVF